MPQQSAGGNSKILGQERLFTRVCDVGVSHVSLFYILTVRPAFKAGLLDARTN